MKVRAAAEWAGFTAGLVIAALAWMWLHLPIGDAGNVQASAGAEASHQNNTAAATGPARPIVPVSAGAKVSDNKEEPRSSGAATATHSSADSHIILPKTVRVYLAGEERVETVPLEIYVRGVVAAEMPPDFQPAALEAQAMAARTYIVRRMLKQDRSDVPVPDADVTDTQTHQAYRSLAEMNRLRTADEAAWRKYHQAAFRTAGRIITYEGEPIQALYFSASNGYTENSEEVFSHKIPYLRSVASHWDLQRDPRAKETVTMPLKEFYEKLGVRIMPAIAAVQGYPRLQVKEWTTGKRVKTLALGGKQISGQEVRSRLGLRSAAFEWSIQDGEITITTTGSGHGVGMSQWGAEGMAQEGHTAEEILSYYYPGTELTAAT